MSTDGFPPIYQEAMKFRAALRRQNDAALQRLIDAYGQIYQRLLTQIRALEADIQEAQAAGVDFSRDWLRRQERYRALIAQTEAELNRYGAALEVELDRLAAEALARAEADALRLTGERLVGLPEAALRSVWNRLPRDAVESLLGFLAPDSPLRKRLGAFGEEAARRISAALLESTALGYSPRKLAKILRQQAGMSLSDALRLARTTQINAYREATRAAYVANSRIVPTWTWMSALDPSGTCLACVAQHGTVHPASERLNDHHNGWCTMLPNVVSYRDLGLNVDGPPVQQIPAGLDWFQRLPAVQQRQFMPSNAAWRAWQDGKLQLRDFLGKAEDDIWGEIIQEMSVKGILGEQARDYYKRAA